MGRYAPWYSLTQVAQLTGISRRALTKYKKREAVPGGRLAHHMRGSGRTMQFRRSSLQIFKRLLREGNEQKGRTNR